MLLDFQKGFAVGVADFAGYGAEGLEADFEDFADWVANEGEGAWEEGNGVSGWMGGKGG